MKGGVDHWRRPLSIFEKRGGIVNHTLSRVEDGIGRIVLNRPQVLNALAPDQFAELARLLEGWAEDDSVRAVVIEGAGDRAFSAGGDIRAAYDNWRAGRHAENVALFRDEYRLDRLVHHYPKPYLAILDGITMGGGAGVSVNGRFRIATERTLFAMPEAAIGFFPDVGATHFLNRCPGWSGLYLGLTGARLGAADALWAGIATHCLPAAEVPALLAELPSAVARRHPGEAIARLLADRHRDPGPSALATRAEIVDRCFGKASVPEIRAALEAEDTPWAAEALDRMERGSPTALMVALRQLREGRGLRFDEAIAREFRLARRLLAGSEFYEGIRAMVVDKDKAPRWQAASAQAVDTLFAPLLDGEPDLD